MQIRLVIAAALAGSILFAAGCKGRPVQDDAALQKSVTAKHTVDLMDEVARAPEYKPPADGRLTEEQVAMYFAVRQREQRIREAAFQGLKEPGFYEAMKATGDLGDLADVATAGLRAAQELGHNPKEYQWVKERVLEAQMLETLRSLRAQVAESQQQILAQLERQRQDTADPLRKAEIGRQIEELKKDLEAAPAESDPAREHNAGLIAQHKEELAKLQAEDERIAHERQPHPQDNSTQSSGDR
jgi:hypothetical protein